MSDDVMLEAGAAAEQVGVSASGLRRLAPLYEAVHGALPRKPKSHNRLWPQIAVERLQRARRLVEAERYRTISDALTALARGLEPEDTELALTAAPVSLDATQQALAVLTDEIRQLRAELAEIKQIGPAQIDTTARPDGFKREQGDDQQHGPLVRFALWIENWLKGIKHG